MRDRIPLSADEFDAFTRWRRVVSWQRGELRKVKRGYWKRVRRSWKREAQDA